MAETEKEKDTSKQEMPPSLQEKLLKSRTLTLFDEVTPKSAQELIRGLLLLEADDPKKEITLFINSPGGEINSGMAVYDMIRFIKPKVRIVATGLCASIGTIILLAADKKQRLSTPQAQFLIHQPLISGLGGRTSDIEITANEITKTRHKLFSLLSKETGQKIEKIQTDADRDYWMTAEEAVTYGLVSKIIDTREDLEK